MSEAERRKVDRDWSVSDELALRGEELPKHTVERPWLVRLWPYLVMAGMLAAVAICGSVVFS